MVRFHWHVEEGAGASILPGSMTYAAPADSGVQHVAVDIEIPGEAAAQACITVPAGYLRQAGQVGELGVLLGHADAAEWRGPLLDALAVMLAEAGHVVVRYHSDGSELRKQRLYEKALDVCATSPFARSVQRWVLAGVGHGARLAALVGTRVRGTVAGYTLLAYPLADKLTTAKSGTVLPDSSVLLLRLDAPVLFVQGATDKHVAPDQIRKVAARMKPKTAPRLAVVPGVDNSFLSGKPPALAPATLAAIREPLLSFVAGAAAGTSDECSAPLANPAGTVASELKGTAAAGIAAQIQMLDDDDAAVYDLEPLGKPGDAANGGGSSSSSQQQKAQQQQQLLLQQAVMQQQQAQLAAAKVGLTLQQAQQAAAVQRVAAAAAAAQQGKPGSGSSAAAGGSGLVLPGGFAQLTPQMLAAAQAMQLAAAKSAGKK